MTNEASSTRTRLRIPGWLYGRDLKGFLDRAGLHGTQFQDDLWEVTTEEAYYHRRRPHLVDLYTIQAPEAAESEWPATLLNRLSAPLPTDANRYAIPEGPSFSEQLVAAGLKVSLAEGVGLQEAASRLMAWLRNGRELTGAGLYFVGGTEMMNFRMKFSQVAVTLLLEPDFDPFQAHRESGPRNVFRASEALQTGRHLMDSYLGPLMGAITPHVWGYLVPLAMGGSLVCSFGQGLSGTAKLPTTLLGTIGTQGPVDHATSAQVDPIAIRAGLDWWCDRLNDTFGVISDPAVFRDTTGSYEPGRQMQAYLTIEQMFRRVTSISAQYSDTDATQALMFSALDSLDNLMGVDKVRLFQVRYAEKILGKVCATMTLDAQRLLLPNALRAVEALRSVQNGFFRATNGHLPGGKPYKGLDEAAARYMILRRNATHGFRPKSEDHLVDSDILLATHTGKLHADIGLLAYLYLLHMLSRPDVLRKRMLGF